VTKRTEKKKAPNRLVRWLRDSRAELRRVVWPTRKETYNLTLIVIGLSAVMGVLMWLFDTVFSLLIGLLHNVL
jgi:preprotein translocase subunit SecE